MTTIHTWKLEHLGKIMAGVSSLGHDPDVVPWAIGVANDIVRLLEEARASAA